MRRVGVPGRAQPRGWFVISEVILGSSATVSFTDIPQSYSALRLEGIVRSAAAHGLAYLLMRLNGDTGANYDDASHFFDVVAAAHTSTGSAAQTSAAIGLVAGTTATANKWCPLDVLIPGYTSTSHHKTMQWASAFVDAAVARRADYGAATWRSTAAITQIDLSPSSWTNSLLAGSRVALLGRK
jgi:hypothetical protein